MSSPTRPRPALLAPVAALALLLGCASSGYDRARSTVRGTDAYRAELERLGGHVEQALRALDTLRADPLDSPQASQETFETFRREVANLDVRSRDVTRAFARMDAGAGTFFAAWSDETGGLTDAALRRGAEDRRAAIEAHYTTVSKGQTEVDAELAALSARLADLVLYLENDLTRAGLRAAEPPLRKAFEEGQAFLRLLEDQDAAVVVAREALEPLGANAPGPGRVTPGPAREAR